MSNSSQEEALWEAIESFMDSGYRGVPVKRFPQYPIPRILRKAKNPTLGDVYDITSRDGSLPRARLIALTILANTRHSNKKDMAPIRHELIQALNNIESTQTSYPDDRAYTVSCHDVKPDMDWFKGLIDAGFISPTLKIHLNGYKGKITVDQFLSALIDEHNALHGLAHEALHDFKREIADLRIKRRQNIAARLTGKLKKATHNVKRRPLLKSLLGASLGGIALFSGTNAPAGNALWSLDGPTQAYDDHIRPHFSDPDEADLAQGARRARAAMFEDGLLSSHHPNAFCQSLRSASPDMLANLEHPDVQRFYDVYVADETDVNTRVFMETVMYAAAHGAHPQHVAALGGKESVSGKRVMANGTTGESAFHYTDLKMAESIYHYRDEILEILRAEQHPDLDKYETLFAQFGQPFELDTSGEGVGAQINRYRNARYRNVQARYHYNAEINPNPAYSFEDYLFDVADYSEDNHGYDYELMMRLKFYAPVMGMIVAKDQLRIDRRVALKTYAGLSTSKRAEVSGNTNAYHVLGSGGHRIYRRGLRDNPDTSVDGFFDAGAVSRNRGVFYNTDGSLRTFAQMQTAFQNIMAGYLRKYPLPPAEAEFQNINQRCVASAPGMNEETAARYAPENFTPQAQARELRQRIRQSFGLTARGTARFVEETRARFPAPAQAQPL